MRWIHRAVGLTAVSALILAACGQADEAPRFAAGLADEEMQAASYAPEPAARDAKTVMQAASPTTAMLQTAMLIRTGRASIEVDSLEPAITAVRALADRVGGYLANSVLQVGLERVRRAELELRVPAERFDEVLSGLEPIGRVEAVHVDAQDVGEEYVDVTARLANARRLEQRLIELLANRTGDLEDVLAVERELARVREESERLQGRIRYLETRVATSTITIDVHEPAPLLAGPGESPIGDALRQAWRNFVGTIAGGIAALGFLLPLAAVATLLGWLARRLWRARPRTAAQIPSNSGVEM